MFGAPKPPDLENSKNEFNWTPEELEMPLLWQSFYLDFLPPDGSKRSVKSSARWNGHKQQVVVRALDGFVYITNGVYKVPGPEERLNIYNLASSAWQDWYLEQLEKPENLPNQNELKH